LSRRANPAVVGGFILGAIGLAVAGIAVFGSISFFEVYPRAVAYFPGSVNGLNPGAPVDFRGVRIGSVTEIKLEINAQTAAAEVPVYIQFDPDLVHFSGIPIQGQVLKDAIKNGLRAQLASQSFVTGQLYVSLQMLPNQPGHVVGTKEHITEIPTIESEMERMKNVLSELPLDQLVERMMTTVDRTNAVLDSPEIHKILASVASAANNINDMIASARGDQKPVTTDVIETLKSAREALSAMKEALADVKPVLKTANTTMKSDLHNTLMSAEGAMKQAQMTLANLNGIVSPNSAQRSNINDTLRSLAAGTRSLRAFADEIERKPNAMVMGR
jgi:paraquat-inducible protein B